MQLILQLRQLIIAGGIAKKVAVILNPNIFQSVLTIQNLKRELAHF